MLTLHEELTLLAMDDATGKVLPQAERTLRAALVSAALTELMLRGKLAADANLGVTVADAAPTGDPLMDDVLKRLTQAAGPQPAGYWMGVLPNALSGVVQTVRDGLVRRRILGQGEQRRLLVFKQQTFPLQSAMHEMQIRDRVRRVVLNNAQPEERTLALIGLIRLANLADSLFARHEWKDSRPRINALAQGFFADQTPTLPTPHAPVMGGPHMPAQPAPAMGMGLGGALAMGMASGLASALMFSMASQMLFGGFGAWGDQSFDQAMAEADPSLSLVGAEEQAAESGDAGAEDFGGDPGGDFGGGDFDFG